MMAFKLYVTCCEVYFDLQVEHAPEETGHDQLQHHLEVVPDELQ